MTKGLLVKCEIATIVGDPDTIPMSVRLPTKEEKILPRDEVEEKNHRQERGGVEMIVMNEEHPGEARIWTGRTVGERCRKLKFFLRFHQDPSMSSSKQRVKGESLHLHTTCRSRAEACKVMMESYST